eukprot:1160337-Pelagomonas_calceolata.AAC.3
MVMWLGSVTLQLHLGHVPVPHQDPCICADSLLPTYMTQVPGIRLITHEELSPQKGLVKLFPTFADGVWFLPATFPVQQLLDGGAHEMLKDMAIAQYMLSNELLSELLGG